MFTCVCLGLCRSTQQAASVPCAIKIEQEDASVQLLRFRLLLLPPSSALAGMLLQHLPPVRLLRLSNAFT